MPLGFAEALYFVPKGQRDSPAFQRWVWRAGENSPEGTAETVELQPSFGTYSNESQSQRETLAILSIPPG